MSDEDHLEARTLVFFSVDDPPYLYGPRAYNAKAGEDGMPRFDMTLAKRKGNIEKADAAITVVEYGDGEIEFEYECLCPACHLMNEDSEEAMKGPVDYNVYGKPEPGTYYVRFWVEEYGGYFEPKDYDVGLEIAE